MPFEVRTIGLTYRLSGLMRVEIEGVMLDAPVIRGEVDDEGVSFFGLERLYERDESAAASSEPSPQLSIEGGAIYLDTAAGQVAAQFEAQGRLIEDGYIHAQIMPASLQHDTASLNWSRGEVDLQFDRGAVTGKIDISIEQANLGALSAQMAQINADMTDRDGALHVIVNASAGTISQGERRGTGLKLDLVGRAARPAQGEVFDLLGALQSVTIEGQADALVDGATRLEGVALIADMVAEGRQLSGPLGLTADGFASDLVQMGAVSVSGDLAYGETEAGGAALAYDGQFVLREIDGSGAGVLDALDPSKLPTLAEPHVRRARGVLARALANFELGASFDAAWSEGQWQVRADEPTLLKAASGLMLVAEPLAGQAWLDYTQDRLIMSGLVQLEGGGGPDFQTYLNDLTWRDGGVEVFARDGVLEKWVVDGAAVSVQFDGLSFQPGQQGEASRFFVDGEVAVSGDLAGIALETTRLFGKIEGAQGSEGWRVQTAGAQCVGLTMGTARSGTVTLSPLAVTLCPVDGRFVRREAGRTVGQIDLGDIEVPFSTIDSSGVFNFADAKLDWVSGDALRMTIRGQRLSLPMRIGDRSLEIDSSGPAVSAIVGGGPLQILAALEDTRFGGTMIPARVRADAFSFDGMAADAGFEGKLRGVGVHISDLDADALYEPLITDLDGDLRDGAIGMTGVLRNEKARFGIADFRLDLDLTELDGTAGLKMRPLNFAPGRLQPTALSERLRGVLTSTRGVLSGQADFNIAGGALDGTGEIVLEDVSFDTFKAGTVTGVNGRIVFEDILELRSEPHQVFTIDELNPGVPLKNGVLQFQLNGADEMRLETARWPFAGGTIRVRPTVWSVNELNQDIMVELSEIELAELVETLKVPDLVAAGTVSGTFPIVFEGANIMVHQAVLKADESGGTLGYTGNATAPVEGQNELADYAFEALRNFNFTVMQLGVDGNLIGRLLLSIDMTGHNDDVLDGKPFKFGITVDSDLLPLLTSLRNLPNEAYIFEAIMLEREAAERRAQGEQSN